MSLIIVFLPLISFIFVGFFGRFFGKVGCCFITTMCVFLSFIFSCISFFIVGLNKNVILIQLCTWFEVGILHIHWGFLFDSLTVTMLIVVTSISTLVHLYSIEYMSEDPHISRFMSFLSFFTFFMLILVTADNFIQMFLGWEGVGVASYLLINFWNSRLQANKSAIKAIIVNRVGDFGLALGIIVIFYVFKSLDFTTVFCIANVLCNEKIYFLNMQLEVLNLISFLLFIGAMGKSAQLGLHTWLPDAMEGPTPVSALIHAATMVTAGVFVLVRCSPILEYATETLFFIAIIGALTAIFAATTGMLQNDLKKVIAYSTCSQLGYMVFSCGISCYNVSMFHLVNHAFFKALLFLGAGSVIHACSNEQDFRKMGGLLKLLPYTYSLMLIGSLSLMGFPFLTGFYSKDLILELGFSFYGIKGTFVYFIGTVAAFFTAFYSIRLLYLTFITNNNSLIKLTSNIHESKLFVSFSLLLLSIGSIFVGYLCKEMFVGIGTNFWNNSIYVLPNNILLTDSEFLPFFIKLIPVIFSLLGAFLSFYFYNFKFNNLINVNFYNLGIYKFLNYKWYFDIIYNNFIVKKFLAFGYKISFKLLDRGWIEYIGPYGLVLLLKELSLTFSKLQSGYIYHYAFVIIFGIVFLVLFLFLKYINFNLFINCYFILFFLIFIYRFKILK